MLNISNQPPQHILNNESGTRYVEDEKMQRKNQINNNQKYPEQLNNQHLALKTINQDKSIQMQHPQMDNSQVMNSQSIQKKESNINQQNSNLQNKVKMTIYLQTPNNESYLELTSTSVKLSNLTEQNLEKVSHYQEDPSHPLLRNWKKESVEQKLYLYSSKQLSQIKQLNQNELELRFENKEGGKKLLKFLLPQDSDIFFIDSSTLEDKLYEHDQAYDKKINSECLTEFALQLLLKETFVKFIKFCNQFDTKFNRLKFLNYLILLGFKDTYNSQDFDLKKFLIFLFAQSVNKDEPIIIPRIKIYDIFINLQDEDRKTISKASDQLNNCKDWHAIKQLIEEVFLKEATYEQSKNYYKVRNTFKLNKSAKEVFEVKIKSESQLNLNEIFNQQYMDESGMTTENYYDLFIEQTFQIQKENGLNYLEKNTFLINFVVEKTQLVDNKDNQNIKKTLNSIVSEYFNDKDLIQIQKILKSKKQIFENLHIEADKILTNQKFNEKLLQINLEKISKEDVEILDQILNSQNSNIDMLFQILQRIKVLDLDEQSINNRIFNSITKKIMDQMQQIDQQDFKQKMENLKQILCVIFINNWNNLDNSQKIKQSIKFEVYRYEFFHQYKQQLVEDEYTLFTNFLKNYDIIQNILEISNIIQSELELSKEIKKQLLDRTDKELLQKLNKIEDLKEFSNALTSLADEKIKQKVFEKNKEQVIKQLHEIIQRMIQNQCVKQIEEWNIQYILRLEVFEQLFDVLASIKEFNQSKIYQSINQIIQKNINLQDTRWKDYKIINEKKERFTKFIQFFSLKKQKSFTVFETFYNDYSKLTCFINLMKKLHVSDIEDKKKLLDSIDQDENLLVQDIQEKFQKIIDKNSELIGTSQFLFELKLFYQISNTYQIKNQTTDDTMTQINTFALPFIECIYQYMLEQEFPERKNSFIKKEIEQFKTENKINTRNCYQILKTYFSDHFILNAQSLQQECENLNKIYEQRFEQKISSAFFAEFVQQGYSRILDYELLSEMQETASNFQIEFHDDHKKSLENIKQLISNEDLSKKQFFEGTQQIKQLLDNYVNDTVQNYKNDQVNRKFLKDQIIPFISSILNVMNLHSKFKNEADLQELLFDDDSDLSERIQHYIKIKKDLEEFEKVFDKNIFKYIQQVIRFFYKDDKSKETRQKIEDISKQNDYIVIKFRDLRTSQAQNSVKILQMFMEYAKIHISVKDTYLEKNQSQKVKDANLDKNQSENVKKIDTQQANNSLKSQEDDKNYKVTYRTQKRVNNKEKDQDYNEEQIFQIIQRLNIISEQQLDEAYNKSEIEKQQFIKNKKQFENFYNLIQKNMIQTLEKFIQYGYLDGFIEQIEILIDGKQNTIEKVIQNIQKIVEDKEKLINEWKDVIKDVQNEYQFMKLIIPQCYPDLLRYFQKLLNVNAIQDSKNTIKNGITIKEQQFGQANRIIQFNIEEMINFYHMNTNSLAKELHENRNQITLNNINEKISLLGKYLNKQFQQGQKVLILSNKTGKMKKNQYNKLEAKKIQCESYGDMCKQMLNYFGNIQPNKLQFFFANQQTTEMDIEAFLNRVIYFEMENFLSSHFFIIDFKKLKYQVQKFATEQIDQYMNIDNEQQKTKNKLIILYLVNQNNEQFLDQDDESTEEDCIRIPLTEEYKNKTPQYKNENIHLFKSDQAGVGKTFQIQKQIRERNQLPINIPAHQFQNIDNLFKILRINKIQFNLRQISVSKQLQSDDQIMLRYLDALTQGVQYLMETDFVKFEAFNNQKLENKKVFSDQEAYQLIERYFDQYKNKYNIKQELTYQSIIMFRQQFVTQIKEMELDPNYTSYQIKELMNNASDALKQNIKSLSWNQKKSQSQILDTNFRHQNQQNQIQQRLDQSDSLFACFKRIFNCFRNTSQQNIPFSSRQYENEMKYLIKGQMSNNNYNQQMSSQIQNLKLSDDEKRIQQMNTIFQYDQTIKNLIFFINGGIIATIFKDDKDDESIHKLEQLMRAFIQQVNRISRIGVNIEEELQLRIPRIGYTEDEYILIRTLVHICSRNPSKFIDEKAQQQKPELSKILQERAFTKDNTCKLIQIAFKIYSGVPLVIMGETGIGKTVNIQILTEIMGFNFEVLRLSAGTTIDQIIKFMKQIKKKHDVNSKIVIFFDEINTNQNIYGILKEIFIEKTINGKKIGKNNQNIVCVAACNPYEYILKKNQNDFEAGLLTRFQKDKAKKANLTYHVYPLPESMLPFVVNYGQLEQKVEEKNIYQMLNKINFRNQQSKQNQQQGNQMKEFDQTINIFSKEELECIQQLIMASQQFVRCQQGSSRSASLRDVSRTIKFIEFFMKEYFLKRGDTNTETQKKKSVILSLYLCYQIRLNSQKQREDYQLVIQYIQSKYAFFNKIKSSQFFDKTVNEELDYFISKLKIDSKLISKNRALKENCFCIALCILTKVPLFITGEPGTSKTLSFTLVINSFKGISSSSIFLQGFPSIKEFYIQGNLQTQSEEIRRAFQQAKEVKINGVLPVVFFDEAGQAELSENNPNKVLHELLDDGDVSFIASSNYSLDYAKQNRCLHLQRNRNSLEDLKEFVNQLVYSNAMLKGVLNDFCDVYYNFHSNLKNYIHNSRDFYYTIKYCYSMYNKNQSKYQEEKDFVNLLYRAMIKNFSGYDENTILIKKEFFKQFQKYKDQIQHEQNTREIIEECFKPICEEFVYHSRFPMLITDNTDQGIEFAMDQLKKNGLLSQVKAGSHFKKDFYEDKTREISSINASIEQNYSIISVNQDYIYAVYYDFFTMNFSRIGDKQKFRLNYKQIQTRIEVPQDYLFVMIVTKDQYMKMDLALLNRFEKHIFSQKLIFQKEKQAILDSIINEFKIIKQPFQKDKHFLSFIKKSYIFGMIQVESKKNEQQLKGQLGQINMNEDNLKQRCVDLIGNLSKKYDIIRLRKENPNNYFQAWNQKIYLDNLIEFVKFKKNNLNSQKQGFYSIIYTNSYLYNNYQVLLKENGFETLLIDLSQIKQKSEFQQQTEFYFQGNQNLMIIKICCQDENPQNIYYIRSFLDECRQKFENINQKSIIMIIQYSNSQHYRLPFCLKWEQYQIDNLLPYAYTQQSLQMSKEIQEINKILNYRNIHGKNERQILEDKKIFNYFTQMPGFCSKLIQKITFKFEPDRKKFYEYYERVRKILQEHFQKKNSIVYNHFYEYFVEHLKQNSNQDDLWSYKFDLIKGLNYEKQMINYLKNKVENVILTILSQYEDKNLLENYCKINNLNQQNQDLHKDVFQQYIKKNIQIYDNSEIKRLPYQDIQFIFSNIIYSKIENTKKFYEFNESDQQYKNYLATQVRIFQEIMNLDKLNDYIEDFLFYKDIQQDLYNQNYDYRLFCQKLLKELNNQHFFKEFYQVHEIFWNNEKIFTEILELINIFKRPQNATDLAQFLVDQEVFTKKKDILENVSEYYYITLQNMEQTEINQIEHFIKIFPLQKYALRFQIISKCYKSFIRYDNQIRIKDLLDIFKEINSEQIASKLQNFYQQKSFYNEIFITTYGVLYNNKVELDLCFDHLMTLIIQFFKTRPFNDQIQVDINLIISYFLKQIKEEIDKNFLNIFNTILQTGINNNLIFNKKYLKSLDTILKSRQVKTEDRFTQLLIRIGEIIFQKTNYLYQLDPNPIIANFKQQEQLGYATVQFIFNSIYFRLIAPEISKIIKEGYELDTFDNRKFNQNQISEFLISLSKNQILSQMKNQYLQLYLLKQIFNEDSSFLKKIQNSQTQKRPQFLFIENFKNLFKQNNFDPYEFPWCQENYVKKLDQLEQYKQHFLELATLRMMNYQVSDNLFNEQQKYIYNKTQNLKNQSSLAKFVIYLASTMMDQSNQTNQLRQFIDPQSSQFIARIYIPFNSLTKKQIEAIDIKNALDCIQDKTKVYQCTCGFVYAVGDCGQNMVTVKCKNCNKNIGGKNHDNINQEYQQQNIQEHTGLVNEFIKDKYFAPRQIDPLAFRFGNLVIYCLIFISSDKNILDENNCIQTMTSQWKIIKELLKLSDEQLLIMTIQLLKQLLKINQGDFINQINRNQFEQQFSQICKVFQTLIPQNQQQFDDNAQKVLDKNKQELEQFQCLLRDKDITALFFNTLQYYQIPQLNELEGQYLQRDFQYKYIIQSIENISKIKLIYPLIYFYKKIHQFYSNQLTQKTLGQQTLQKCIENKPYLLKYYDENVQRCWNQLQEFIPQIGIGCQNEQSTQVLKSADKVPLEDFLIIKKESETQASAGDQLYFFITQIKSLQNCILKEIQNENRQSKDIFELYDDDMISISQNFNLENLIYFENLQLEVGQQIKKMNTELLKNYYIFDQLQNKSFIKDFQDANYFKIKKDTTYLGSIYSSKIIQGNDNHIERINPKMKEGFLKQCQQQEQKFEIREQLFFLHDLMKNIPQEEIKQFLEYGLKTELERQGFIVDEPYFKECLRQFKVCHIFDLLVILETELMDDLVQNLDTIYKVPLPEDDFEKFLSKFKLKILDVLNKKLLTNSNKKDEIQNKSNKDLQIILGRYIIRNLLSQKQSSNFTELNIFENINYFPDQQYLEPLLLDGEDEINFEDLNIQHKYIYSLYERLAQDFKKQLDIKQKLLQSQKQEASKNINNQQMIIFGFEMDKQQLNGIQNKEHDQQINKDESNDDDDDAI
ncbi:hypothetical protein ABPG72_005109 [Tetrahymena utriculariae]